MRVATNLNEGASKESFGIDNVVIKKLKPGPFLALFLGYVARVVARVIFDSIDYRVR